MELHDVEKFFNTTFGESIRFRPGLYYPKINPYFIFTDKLGYSFYIVHLPYQYYMILEFSETSLNLLKYNCWRFDGYGIVGLNNMYLYDKNK